MGIPRSSFYASSRSGARKTNSEAQRDCCIALIKEVRKGHRTHGYRWINAEMRRRFGVVYTDNFVHRCCKWAGIRADIGRVRHRRPRSESVICPNLRPSWHPEGPLEVVTSDMTILRHRKGPIELTLYIDAFNNEIASYGASRRAGDTRPYFDGLEGLARKMKKEQRSQKLVLHTDQGSVYSSVRFNDLCEKYSIIHSMSRAGTPTDNPMDESINGWMKDELYGDFGFYESDDPFKLIDRYVKYWNNQRFSCALNYKTPTEYKLNRG